jgi:hypothetical protein
MVGVIWARENVVGKIFLWEGHGCCGITVAVASGVAQESSGLVFARNKDITERISFGLSILPGKCASRKEKPLGNPCCEWGCIHL